MRLIQPSFARGEFSPSLYSRVDLANYHVAAARMRNFFVDFRGGATTRPGTRFIGRTKFATYTRLIKFQFSVVQTYVLEFGNQYIRVIMDGGYVLETAKVLTAATQANPGVLTSAAHGYVNGDWVYIAGIVGMTQLNGNFYIVAGATANTFTLTDLDGVAINSTAFGAYVSGGTSSRVYEVSTPYLAADLPLLKYTQSADVMTLTHPEYEPRDLTRTAHDAWTLDVIGFGSAVDAPTGLDAEDNYGGGATEATGYSYVVTAVDDDGDESIASNIDTEVAPRPDEVNSSGFPIDTWRMAITWNTVTGASYYNVYRAPIIPSQMTPASGALYGFIGSTDGTTFYDPAGKIDADYSITPPKDDVVFAGVDDYPGSVAYFQQRKVFARTNNKPQTLWLSQVGLFNNFNSSRPTKASDAITIPIVSQQVNEIKHMVPMPSGLVLLTGGSAFQLSAAGEGGLSPATAEIDQQTYTGVSDLPPITVGFDILFVQSKGATVRSLSYDFFKSIYAGADISFWSSHFFYGRTVVSWDYAEEPFRIAWVALDNGDLLSYTYVKDQEVAGWALHHTQGRFKDVCSIPEGTEDAIYFITQRRKSLNGDTLQMIERMESRIITATEETWAVDCGLSTELVYPAGVLRPQAASGNGVGFRVSGATPFVIGDIGKHIRAGGGKAVITGYTSSTIVTADIIRPISEVENGGDGFPATFDSGEWSMTPTVTTISGLSHLEGQDVKVLADGFVYDNTVVGGAITLAEPASLVRVGLGYTCQFQTLPIELGEPTVQGEMKRVSELTTRLHLSRGLQIGSTFDTLKPMREPDPAIAGQPIELYSSDNEQFYLDASWNTQGQICFEQDQPLPTTILGVMPKVRIAVQKTSDDKRS